MGRPSMTADATMSGSAPRTPRADHAPPRDLRTLIVALTMGLILGLMLGTQAE